MSAWLESWQNFNVNKNNLIVVDFDAFKLEFRGSVVVAGGLDTVLVRDDIPELKSSKG